MLLYPAIDLYEGKAVRLLKGEYQKMTVYSENPAEVAKDFQKAGATSIHLVDLEGAKFGTAPNLDTIAAILRETNLFVEVGGGIRSMEVIEKYLSLGVDRVILGTAAVTNRAFLEEALRTYGERIAVGVDLKDGYVAIKGRNWEYRLLSARISPGTEPCRAPTGNCTARCRKGTPFSS